MRKNRKKKRGEEIKYSKIHNTTHRLCLLRLLHPKTKKTKSVSETKLNKNHAIIKDGGKTRCFKHKTVPKWPNSLIQVVF